MMSPHEELADYRYQLKSVNAAIDRYASQETLTHREIHILRQQLAQRVALETKIEELKAASEWRRRVQ